MYMLFLVMDCPFLWTEINFYFFKTNHQLVHEANQKEGKRGY